MRVISIPLARALALVEWEELILGGKVRIPYLASELTQLCSFIKFPSEPKDFDLGEGVTFETGEYQGRAIKKLVVHPGLIYLDGGESVEDSRDMLIGLLEWARGAAGLNFSPSSIRRWAFVSNIVIQTDFPLLNCVNNTLNKVATKVSEIVRGNLHEDLKFYPSKFYVGIDPQRRSAEPAPFSIQHRALTLFEENIYYCEAPIPTRDHFALLEEIETEFRTLYESR